MMTLPHNVSFPARKRIAPSGQRDKHLCPCQEGTIEGIHIGGRTGADFARSILVAPSSSGLEQRTAIPHTSTVALNLEDPHLAGEYHGNEAS